MHYRLCKPLLGDGLPFSRSFVLEASRHREIADGTPGSYASCSWLDYHERRETVTAHIARSVCSGVNRAAAREMRPTLLGSNGRFDRH
jgi:hypothetical protein